MGIAELRSGFPDWAKDTKLNLGSLTRSKDLNEQQLWGTMLAVAASAGNATVLREIDAEAKEHLSEAARDAAFAAATVMAMNNVAYRSRAWLGDDYSGVRIGLRMNVISDPGVEKADFELWSLAVSAVNGCEHCLTAHEHTLREEGLSRETIWEAVKVAGTVRAAAQAYDILATTGSDD